MQVLLHVNEKKSEIRWNSKQADIKKNRYLETHPLGIVYGKVRAAEKKPQHEEFYFQQGRAIHTVYVSSCLCSALFCGDTEKGIKTGVFHEHSYLFTWISHHSLLVCLDVCVQRSRWVYATV